MIVGHKGQQGHRVCKAMLGQWVLRAWLAIAARKGQQDRQGHKDQQDPPARRA